jgi:HEAT repeat protein
MRFLLGVCGMLLWTAVSHGADVNELVKQLKEGDNDARRAAAKALADGGPGSKEAVSALIKALKDQDMFVRRFSAQALGEIGLEARSASSALLTALNDPRKEVQSAAARALGKLGPSGVEALIGLIKDERKDSTLRRQAVDSLGNLGSAGHAGVPVLTEVVKEKPPKGKKKQNAPDDLRIDAATALGALATTEDKDAVEVLQALADKKSKAPRGLKQAANMALRKIRGNSK